GSAYEDQGLVFARENGTPIRPEHVVKRFGPLCRAAGVPKITVHDLRHTAATLMIGSGIPLAVVSKVLRHTQVSITTDLYGHLTPEIATSAADTFGAAPLLMARILGISWQHSHQTEHIRQGWAAVRGQERGQRSAMPQCLGAFRNPVLCCHSPDHRVAAKIGEHVHQFATPKRLRGRAPVTRRSVRTCAPASGGRLTA
ncbi:MAG: tyrosine-type recombinase/integrase, partial [Actinobacteria bacterium]|nr:tyrosine-type recombinase/integrase [Actinomycetota bacterium]